MESWSAIGEYNRFLLNHPQLYSKAQVVPDLLVVLEDPVTRGEISPFLDVLTRQNLQFDVSVLSRLSQEIVRSYWAVALVGLEHLSLNQVALLDSYRRSGGKIYSVGQMAGDEAPADIRSNAHTLATLETSEQSKAEVINNLSQLIKNRTIRLENSGQVLAVVTKIRNAERAVVHFVNHDEQPRAQLRITLDLAFLSFRPEEELVRAYSPDAACDQITELKVNDKEISFTIPKLDTYFSRFSRQFEAKECSSG